MNMDVYVVLKTLVRSQAVCLDKLQTVFILLRELGEWEFEELNDHIDDLDKFMLDMSECREMLGLASEKEESK